MKVISWFVFILCFPLYTMAGPGIPPKKSSLKLGAERMEVVTRLLKDKRVALVVNQTSVIEDGQVHLLDALLNKGIDVKKVFAPEHGFRD